MVVEQNSCLVYILMGIRLLELEKWILLWRQNKNQFTNIARRTFFYIFCDTTNFKHGDGTYIL